MHFSTQQDLTNYLDMESKTFVETSLNEEKDDIAVLWEETTNIGYRPQGNIAHLPRQFPKQFSPRISSTFAQPATLEISQDTNWYPDSGAMNHLTSDLNNLMTKTQFFASDQVFVGNGQGLSIHYIGHQVKNEESYEESWAKLRIQLPRVNPDCKEKKQRESVMEHILDDSPLLYSKVFLLLTMHEPGREKGAGNFKAPLFSCEMAPEASRSLLPTLGDIFH
ncbi:hypothetical protein CK203_021188 [Vitis vinifera]|uniref:Uncharacterized protein n=1 Tax=Vitis vinifera TaxID=29760 RepID=A0A438IM44_VITVI|nr:hypothetical protein CK203_021188 [Vitis vinifera]